MYKGPYCAGTLDANDVSVSESDQERMKNGFGRAGFDIERLISFNRVGVLPWFLNGRILRKTRFGKFQLKIYDSLVWLWRIVDRLIPLPGLSVICIARKPTTAAIS